MYNKQNKTNDMKIIRTEVLESREIEIPVITGAYDALTKKKDGTITSQGPIIVSGEHFDVLKSGNLRLCLAPAVDNRRVIEVSIIYKFLNNKVIVSLPFLLPGEYYPAVKLIREDAEDCVYIFPVLWVVTPEIIRK